MTSRNRSEQPYEGPERRAFPRIPAASVPYLTAHVAGGPAVRLLDLSKHGVRIASTMRMPPGSTVGIRFVTADASVTLTGAVVRSACAVVEASGEVTYHTALAFTEELTLCAEALSGADADADAAALGAAEAAREYTMIVLDERTGSPLHEGAGSLR